MNKIASILILILALSACSPYQKAIKSDDIAVKVSVADDLYNKNKYSKALRLYETVLPVYRSKPQGERVMYHYSMCLYNLGLKNDAYLNSAGYQFESFVATYPRSEKREQTAYLSADSYYRLSPRFSLDQVDTDKALSKLQKFIDAYPNSEYLPQANAQVKELQTKLEKKAFEIAKQYYLIADYRLQYDVAIKSLDNFVSDYPGTPYKAEALFLKFKAAYSLAQNSVETKKEERYNNAKVMYNNLDKFNNASEYKKEADEILASIDKELQQISK